MYVHEKAYKYIVVGLLVLLLFTLTGNCIQEHRLGYYRQQSEYYRVEYERASNQQQLLADTVDKCWESTERTKELLGGSISSIAELREQLREVRKNYENMEVLLLDCYNNMYSGNNGTTNYEERR